MTNRHQVALLAAWLFGISGCAGRALDLDRSESAGAAGAGGATAIDTVKVNDDILEFWADDSRIYWAKGFGYSGCVFSQCDATLVSYSGTNSRTDLLPFGDQVLEVGLASDFLTPRRDGSMVFGCPKTGCVGAPSLVLSDPASIQGVVGDGDYLYWLSTFDIYRCKVDNCGDIPDLVAARQHGNQLLVQGENAYWSTSTDSGWILSAPSDGSGPPQVIVPNDAISSYGFALGQHSVFWIDQDGVQVRSCPIAGCAAGPSSVVTDDAQKDSLFADATGLYWLERNFPADPNGLVHYCPPGGCEAGSEPLILSSNSSQKFVVTASYVYWDEVIPTPNEGPVYSRRNIHRAPKPNANP